MVKKYCAGLFTERKLSNQEIKIKFIFECVFEIFLSLQWGIDVTDLTGLNRLDDAN